MKTLLALSLLICSGAALAQATASEATIPPTSAAAISSTLDSYHGDVRRADFALADTSITPTMRRERLARAVALREKVLMLQAQDGGVLSAQSIRYINREARKVLGDNGPWTGTLTGYQPSAMVRCVYRGYERGTITAC